MIITQTPLRISFAGGGTDFSNYYSLAEGYVVNSAIDKYIYVIVKERFDDKIYVNYSRKEIVDSVDELRHELVREAMKKTGVGSGVEVTMLADVPSEGSGLGSSSSLTVGLLNSFYSYQGMQVTSERLAEEACEIEIDICKKPIGKQDQYIAAFGGLCAFKFCRDGSVEVERIRLPESKKRQLGGNLLLFYTGRTRQSTDILLEQNEQISANVDALNEIKALAHAAKASILNGSIYQLGEILDRNWELKKQLAGGVTDPEIDTIYEKAKAAGALGGKIAGAGGGGFLLLFCPRDKQDAIRERMSGFKELPFFLERDGSKVIFNLRRYEWK